jgi:hypothetical protein
MQCKKKTHGGHRRRRRRSGPTSNQFRLQLAQVIGHLNRSSSDPTASAAASRSPASRASVADSGDHAAQPGSIQPRRALLTGQWPQRQAHRLFCNIHRLQLGRPEPEQLHDFARSGSSQNNSAVGGIVLGSDSGSGR